MIDFQAKFNAGYEYGDFLEKYGSPDHQQRWAEVYKLFQPTEAHRSILKNFVREMNVLCLAGAWCGDCVSQCPILQRFSETGPRIHLRFVDRDADAELADELRICGGARVPAVVFLSEDFAHCARYGDRTLARYRAMAQELSGAACSTGLVGSDDALIAVADDWLGEFERVQLMLRLSPRLREKHGD